MAKSKWFVRKYELYSTTIINRRLEVFQERKFRTDSIANLKQKFKNVLNARSRLGKTSCLKQLKYLGILFTSDGKVKRELDCSTGVTSGVICACAGPLIKKWAKLKGAFNLIVHLHAIPNLWL